MFLFLLSMPVFSAEIARFQLEDLNWNGTANEVVDSSGNNQHGTVLADTIPLVISPAITGNPGTCGYASQNRGSISIPNLPVSTKKGDKTTVTFWMKWDGTSNVMPVGWRVHDLWLVNGNFGFNTGNSDVYGVSSAGLANTWHHISAEFTNGNVAANRLVIDGIEQTLTQLQSNPSNTNAYVTNDLRIGGWAISTGYRFSGAIDEVRVYTGSLKVAEVQAIMKETQTCGMVAEWRFDELKWTGTIGDVNDSSGNNYHGTAFGGVDTVAGKVCRAGDFQGTKSGNDDYIDAGTSGFNITGELTISAWVKARAVPGFSGYGIVSRYRENSSKDRYGWNLGTTQKGNKLTFKIEGGGNSGITVQDSDFFKKEINNWKYVTGVYKPGEFVRLYIDGVLIDEVTKKVPLSIAYNTTDPLTIGRLSGSNSGYFDGLIDEVRIHDIALTQSEIQINMTQTRACFVSGPDHFLISHDGAGIHCAAETIQVSVMDTSNQVLTDYKGTITLDTQTGTGNWTGTTGSGLLTDSVPDDGLATYSFVASDNGKAGFVLNYPSGSATFNIDVYEGAIRDDDSEGDISFAPSGFILTKNVISNPPPAVINDPVADQIAATDFNVHITAYGTTETDAECGVIESYTGSKTINLIGSYINPANGTKSLSINSSGIAMTPPATSRPITFNNGQAVVVANYKDAGKIHFTIEDTTGPTLISGSTNDFVVKPASFIFQEISRVADNFSNPAAVDANGPVFIAAGQNFNIKVAAVNALNQVTTNYGNETPSESVALTHVLIAPAGGDAGTLIGNLSPQGNGIFTGIFNWSEVGIISMDANVADLDYLGAGNISGSSGNVGRFVPDHFVVADKLQGALDVNCTAGGFNYIGQSFGFVLGNHPEFKIQAKNLTGATTRNYTGSFAKLGLASVLISPVNQDSTNAMTITHQQSVASFLIAGNGVFNYTLGADLFTYDRSTTPVGLFDSDIDIIINSIADSDGVTDNFSAPEKLEPTAANIRYGRLMIESAFGSELVDLELPVRAEIYDSALGDYITHTDDTCSSFSVLPLEMLDSLDPSSLTSTLALPLAAGTTTLTISAPGEGNTGSVGVVLDAPSWLEFDWGRPLTETNRLEPKATASFGIYHGNDAFIYRREIR